MSHDTAAAPGEIPLYASTKLIAYIGNKRALLPFLRAVFDELAEAHPIRSFLDPFAGSGSVSRLARCLGYRVMANDAEEYSRAVNECWLGIPAETASSLFAEEGGIGEALAQVNRCHPSREDEAPAGLRIEPYIARHYAPAATDTADWRCERLFYTHENAVFLDRVRSYIEHIRPAGVEGRAAQERALLVGCLVYEAATHANTSGVFKAYHKGFGGHGKDALGRIMSPMELEFPLLWPGAPAEIGCGDALRFCAGRPADLCYLDPPYNQHQYGSNYHLLNTIARWDQAPVSEERHDDGSLVQKAGIPPAWMESRSDFCSRVKAPAAFLELFDSIDARCILLSYNSEGIVPVAELYDMLARKADVELRSVGYVKYRGGKQSAARLVHNREILFVARRHPEWGRAPAARPGPLEPSAPDQRRARDSELAKLDADLRLERVLSATFDPERLAPLANESGNIVFRSASCELCLPTYRLLVIERRAEPVCAALAADDKARLAALLEPAVLSGNRESCEACIRLLESGCRDTRLQDMALDCLRKIAHRKYGEDFEAASSRLGAVAERQGLPRLAHRLSAIEALYGARLAGRASGGDQR
jgi:adenine-specific DNA-methyltransferase